MPKRSTINGDAMSTGAIVGIVLAVFFAAAYVAVGAVVARKMLVPRKPTVQEVYEKHLKRGKLVEGDMDIPCEKFELQSRFGYKLEGRLYRAKENPDGKIVFWLHGYNSCYVTGLIQYKLYSELGYDVFLPSHRYSAGSGGVGYTFGVKEKEDVKLWVDFVRDNFSYKRFALAGESMGAATAALVASEMPVFDFLVLDSPYSGLYIAATSEMGFKYPRWLKLFMPAVFLIAALRGAPASKVNVVKAVKAVKVPTFLSHSKADTRVLYVSSERIVRARPDVTFVPYEDSPHCQAVFLHAEDYKKRLFDFVRSAEAETQKNTAQSAS